jgi:hypothetical protein
VTTLKKRFNHWTPRYILDRMILGVHQRFNPDAPWLTKNAIWCLRQLLRPSDIGLEFGSGRSTVWFAQRTAYLTSVESDSGWWLRVKTAIEKKSLRNVNLRLHDVSGVPRTMPLSPLMSKRFAQSSRRLWIMHLSTDSPGSLLPCCHRSNSAGRDSHLRQRQLVFAIRIASAKFSHPPDWPS